MLTPLELDIMKAVWKNSPITVRTVQESIRPERNLAYTTVMTIMDRLHHKGILRRNLHSRTHYYEPAIDYTAVRNEALENLIRSFFGSKENLREFLSGDEVPIPGRPNGQILSPSGLDETLL
jgi:predicted transcriptional regulator